MYKRGCMCMQTGVVLHKGRSRGMQQHGMAARQSTHTLGPLRFLIAAAVRPALSEKGGGAPLKQDASNCSMDGLSSCPTDSRSSVVWYSMPSAPSTCALPALSGDMHQCLAVVPFPSSPRQHLGCARQLTMSAKQHARKHQTASRQLVSKCQRRVPGVLRFSTHAHRAAAPAPCRSPPRRG